MILEKLSRRIAIAIKKADPEGPGSVAVIEYSIGMKLNLFAGVLLTVIFGVLLNVLVQSIVALVGLIALRRFTGGLHLPITVCSFVTAGLSLMAAITPLNHIFIFMLTLLGLVIVIFFAPSSLMNDSNTEFHRFSKLIAAVLVCSNFALQSSTLALMFFIQSILILPIYSLRGGELK